MAETLRRVVPVDGADLEVLIGGPDGPGTRTLCTAHPTESMDATLPLLARTSGARVISINVRGVGGSSQPADTFYLRLEGMADDMDAVRQALDLRTWGIWGMSGGSMIAMVYALRHPEALDALILDSAGPCFRLTVRDPDCVMSPAYPAWREALAQAALASPAAGADAGADLIWQEVPRAGWVLRHAGGPAVLVSPSQPSLRMRCVMPNLLAFDARLWLSAIHVPTLVLGGADDLVAPPAHLRALHEVIPGSSCAIIEGAGHVPVVNKPDEVAAVMRTFWARDHSAWS